MPERHVKERDWYKIFWDWDKVKVRENDAQIMLDLIFNDSLFCSITLSWSFIPSDIILDGLKAKELATISEDNCEIMLSL